MSIMNTSLRQNTSTRSRPGSKSDDSLFVSVTNDEVAAIQRAVVAAVKEVQELVNTKLDEVQKKTAGL